MENENTGMAAIFRGACAGLRELGLEVKEAPNGAVLVRVPMQAEERSAKAAGPARPAPG